MLRRKVRVLWNTSRGTAVGIARRSRSQSEPPSPEESKKHTGRDGSAVCVRSTSRSKSRGTGSACNGERCPAILGVTWFVDIAAACAPHTDRAPIKSAPRKSSHSTTNEGTPQAKQGNSGLQTRVDSTRASMPAQESRPSGNAAPISSGKDTSHRNSPSP